MVTPYGLGPVVLKGSVAAISTDLDAALSDWPKLERTLDGATTLTLTVDDHARQLVTSPQLAQRSYADVEALRFELVGVSKAGDTLTLTFEDALTAAMRRHAGPGPTISPGTMTRGAIITQLVRDCGASILVEEPSGTVLNAVEFGADTNAWELSGQLADAVAWRRFSDGVHVLAGSDRWLMDLTAPLACAENTGGVGNIDWELDTGQPANRATLSVDAEAWTLAPGHCVKLRGQGPADGVWLVETYSRSIGLTEATVTLTRQRLALAEPPPQTTDGSADPGEQGNLPDASGFTDPGAGSYAGTKLSSSQVGFAVRIAKVAAGNSLGTRGAVLGIMCALQESSLKNLTGGDRDSVGLFQQRPSMGWGTVAQCRDPEYAAGQFYTRLRKVSGWATMAPTAAIQAVQHSGTPTAYARWQATAEALVAAMAPRSAGSGLVLAGSKSTPALDALATAAEALASKHLPYVFGGKSTTKGLDCSGFVAAITAQVRRPLTGGSKEQWGRCKSAGKLVDVQTALATRGALLFRMTGSPTHVAVSLGDGRTAEARGTAYGVAIFGGASGRQWTDGATW